MVRLAILGIVATASLFPVYAQVTLFPYKQDFDSIAPPMLPPGWASTHNRYPLDDDFSTTSTSSYSPPNAVLARNATLEQALLTPVFDFSNGTPEYISFYCRRSSSFRAPVVLELSTDGGASFPVSVGDTLKPDAGFGQYLFSHIPLPDTLRHVRSVVIRWRVVPDTAGSSGTIRFDDVVVQQQLSTDLEVSLVRFMPSHPTEDENVDAVVRVHNRGARDVSGFTLSLAHDANGDSVTQEGEILAEWSSISTLVSGDSVEIAESIGSFPPGEHRCIVICVCDGDQNISNNTKYCELSVGYRSGTIRINEIMYAPTGTEPEWVELFNAAGNSVNIEQWQLADRSGGTPQTLAMTPTNLEPAEFVLLTRDSAALLDLHPDVTGAVLWVPRLPTLNNSGDEVVLYDKHLRTMDSVWYEPSWGGSKDGRSLERIDPWRSSTLRSNWGGSLDSSGSTPGRENSIARKNHDLEICSLALSPKATWAGQPLDVFIGIRNTGREEIRGFSLSLYDDADRDSIPVQGELVGNRTEAIVLGSEDSCAVAWRVIPHRSGFQQYIVILDSPGDEDSANNIAVLRTFIHAAPGVVRINEVMYAPAVGRPEWVELTNISSETVGLDGWTIGNRNMSAR
ncbi:MAG: lamin tail domain-containing protein, partial [Bacteroidetes bacterium]|nr:lamin tail domain-containing protein [Bacteroidota bacterium]